MLATCHRRRRLRADDREPGGGARVAFGNPSSNSTRASKSRSWSARRPAAGYDTYARLLARHLGDHIPGNPAVVVQNMSGAGSNRAAGYIYSVAPKDGTVAGAIFPGAILQPLLGGPPVQHEPAKFLYLGNANSDVYVCFVRADAPVKDFKDALSTELIVGASGDGATTRDFPVMLNNLLGAKFKLVMGYPGSREITLAMERGEVQGVCGIGWTGIEILYPEWFAKGTIKPLVQLSVKGHRDLHARKVPTTLEFARNDDERERDGADLQPGRVRPALRAAARRPGGSRCRAAQGVHGHVRRSRGCWPRPRR